MYAAVSAAYYNGEVLAFDPSLDSTSFPARDTYQVVQFNGTNTLVDTRNDLLCDSSSIDMLGVKAVTKSRDTRSDLVELYALFASVCKKFGCVSPKVDRGGVSRRSSRSQSYLQIPISNSWKDSILTSLVDKHYEKRRGELGRNVGEGTKLYEEKGIRKNYYCMIFKILV